MKAIIPSVIFYSSCIIAASAVPIDYDTQVRPFLKDNCIACHNKTTTKGGLNMETPELMAKGGESDVGIIPWQRRGEHHVSGCGPHLGLRDATEGQQSRRGEPHHPATRACSKSGSIKARRPRRNENSGHRLGAAACRGAADLCARRHGAGRLHCRRPCKSDQPLPPAHAQPRHEAHRRILLKSGLYKQPGVAHRDLVQSLAFSPDGTRLATGSFREVKLWKRETKPAAPVPTHPKLTAVQEADNSIKLTETAGGKLIAHIKTDLVGEQLVAQRTLAATRAVWKSRIKTRPSRKRRPMPRSRRIV
jgi:hypothetical protein